MSGRHFPGHAHEVPVGLQMRSGSAGCSGSRNHRHQRRVRDQQTPPRSGNWKCFAWKLGGASRDRLASRIREQRSANKKSTNLRTSYIHCPLPTSAAVTLKGEAMSLLDVIELLGQLLKEAKKANDSGLDVKTWAAVLRDKAKAKA